MRSIIVVCTLFCELKDSSGKNAFITECQREMGSISTKLMKRHLEWLGHLARMSDQRTPTRVPFGWLKKTPPQDVNQREDGEIL